MPSTAGVGVGLAAFSGVEAAGALGGVLAGIAAIGALFLSVSVNNAKKRRDYINEIDAAEQRGEKQRDDALRPWMEWYQKQYEWLLNQSGAGQRHPTPTAPPTPPPLPQPPPPSGDPS